jgi:hypothetical protein
MTPEENTAKFDKVLKILQQQYPEAGLSFGYIGNVGRGYGTYDDLQWFFFTKVWESNPGFYRNCHSFSIGLTPQKRETDAEALLPKLIEWLNTKVVPDYGTPCTR